MHWHAAMIQSINQDAIYQHMQGKAARQEDKWWGGVINFLIY